jgi:hypothetical protein
MNTYLPLITAAFGALLGGTLAYWLQRARPVVVIDSIRRTIENSDETLNTQVNRSVIQQLNEYERILDLEAIDEKESITERSYVLVLSRARRDLQDEIQNYLPRVQAAAREFQLHLLSGELDRADQSFARDTYLMWEPLAVATSTHRKEIFSGSRPSPAKAKPESRVAHHKVTVDDGDFIIDMPGTFNAVLGSTNYPMSKRPTIERVAHRVADALAYRDIEDLHAVADAVQAIAEDRAERARSLLALLEEELTPHRRFVVEGIVANAGRTAFSVSNRCKFVIRLSRRRPPSRNVLSDPELTLRLAAPSAGSRPPAIYIDADHRTAPSHESEATLDFSTPLLVPPGQAQRFVCVSDLPAVALTSAAEILGAFDRENMPSYLVLGSIGNRRRQFSAIYSRDVLFRDLINTAELPQRNRWRLPLLKSLYRRIRRGHI